MAHTPEHALLAQGTAQGQGLDILALARQQADANRSGQRGQEAPGTGIGLIDIFTRGKRREAGEQIRAAEVSQQAAIETQAGANLLLQNLDIVQTIEQANTLREGLTNPDTRSETLQRIGVTRAEPARELALNATQLAMAQSISAEERAIASDFRAQDTANFEASMRPGKILAQQQGAELRAFQLEVASRTAGIAPLVPEKVPMINPFTNAPTNASVAGEAYQKQQNGADSYMRVIANINDLSELIREFGSEMTGEQSTIMSNKRNSIIFQTVQARGGGAPQEAELELAADSLKDPTSFGSNLRGGLNILAGPAFNVARAQQIEGILGGYADLNLEVSRAIKDMLKINPALNVDMSLLNPAIWSNNNEREYYQQNSGTSYVTGARD